MISKRAVKISQTGLATLSLFGLIFISGAAVTALNPIVEEGSANISSGNASVAGVSTIAYSKLPLNLNLNLSQNSSFNVEKLESTQENILGTIKVSASKLVKTTYKEDLITLYNPNNVDAKAKVSFFMPQQLKGKIKVYLEDSRDSLIMYTIEDSYGPKTITIPQLSERRFKIKVEAMEQIDEPLELVFVFTVGQ